MALMTDFKFDVFIKPQFEGQGGRARRRGARVGWGEERPPNIGGEICVGGSFFLRHLNLRDLRWLTLASAAAH